MSSIFQGLLDANGRISVGAGPAVSYFRSLPLNAAGQIVVGAGPITEFCQGIPRNAAGAVVGLQSTSPTFYGPGATPYGPNGELESAPAPAAVALSYQGVPYTANGIYCGSGAGGSPIIVAKDFTLTSAQFSVSLVGWRGAPAAGTLAPDAAFGSGTMTLVTAGSDDKFDVVFGTYPPGISGQLSVQLPIYLGPTRLVLGWDGFDRFTDVVPGIYAYLQSKIGVGLAMRLSAAPAGSA